MIVVDASALLDALIGERRANRRLAEERLAAPHLLDAECANVIRRHVLGGAIEEAVGRQALTDLTTMEIDRYPHRPLLSRTWDLRENLTTYDALYVALAEALDAPLLTFDARIAAAPGLATTVEVIGLG